MDSVPTAAARAVGTSGIGPLWGAGLFALIMLILALVSWLLYRWARVIFAEEPSDK